MIEKKYIPILLDLQEKEISIERLETSLIKLKEEEDLLRMELLNLEQEEAHLLINIRRVDEDIESTREEIVKCKDGIKRTENRLNLVKKANEYKALLREKAKYEDCVIKLTEKLRRMEMEKKEAQAKHQETTRELKRRYREIKDNMEDVNLQADKTVKKLYELKEQVGKLRNAIPGDVLLEYDNLRREFGGEVIVRAINSGVCGGCFMKLPAALYSKLMMGEIVRCPNCGRFVCYET
ncbi:MAG: zinc ribbon domain-containing protein [Aquificaceae bacterium]